MAKVTQTRIRWLQVRVLSEAPRILRVWWNGIHSRLIDNLSALLETVGVELVKFGEGCKMLIPSQAWKQEGVETRWQAPKAKAMVKV